MSDEPTRVSRPVEFKSVLDILNKRKIINSSVTLEDIAAASAEIAASRGTGPDTTTAAWTFITKHYIYTGDDGPIVAKT